MYASIPPRFLGWVLVLAGLGVGAALVAVSRQDLPLAVVLATPTLGAVLVCLGLLVLGEHPRARTVAARVTAGGLVLLVLAYVLLRWAV